MQTRALVLALLVLSVSASAAGAAPPREACDTPAARAGVASAVKGFFEALSHADGDELRRVLSPSFYAFDAGTRFDAASMLEAIRGYHRAGVVIRWNPGPLDIHLSCSEAWASWENHGAAGPSGAVKPALWLESAVLSRRGGAWTIDFLHSTLVEAKP